MSATARNNAAVGVFPSSDHLPLGRRYGAMDVEAELPSRARPFGLTVAVPPRQIATVDPAEIGYDDGAQVGLIRDGDVMVPLAKHTTGTTNTVTQGGDGQHHNKDSDTDARED